MTLSTNEVLERACCIYEEELRGSEEGQKYLASRVIKAESIRKFRLGCAPDGNSFLEKKLALKLDKKLLKQTGLIGEAPHELGGTYYYHRFNHRILIPVFNLAGEIIGFGGRALCERGSCIAKYEDTVGSNEFSRLETFYATNFARGSVLQTGELWVFEGYFDVIMAHQSGLTNSVAMFGATLCRKGFDNLREMFPEARIRVCYDGDESGQKNTERTAQELAGCAVDVFNLRGYKDPADLFKDGKNLAEFLVASAK